MRILLKHPTPRRAYAEYLRCERGLVVSEDNDRRASVVDCAFDDTLLVELTEVQHFGQLKIDSVARGTVQPHMNAFDIIADKLYREAVRHILRGVEGGGADLALQQAGDVSFYRNEADRIP